jgi:hypothetical protein
VTSADAGLEGPVPAAFNADTRNTYAVPLLRPVTVADGVVDTPSVKVVHVVPPLEENCTR